MSVSVYFHPLFKTEINYIFNINITFDDGQNLYGKDQGHPTREQEQFICSIMKSYLGKHEVH